jgi:CheY-like chemotaxis protein/PAS domain-containing protein
MSLPFLSMALRDCIVSGTKKKRRVLCIADGETNGEQIPTALSEWCDVVKVGPNEITEAMAGEPFDGFFIMNRRHNLPGQFWNLLQASSIFDQMCDGIAIVDEKNRIVWTNRRLSRWFAKHQLVGNDFYDALGNPSIHGDSANPLASALRSGASRTATMRVTRRKQYRVTATPLDSNGSEPTHLLVTFTDIANEVRYLQKLEAIHNAGAELADLTPEEVYRMSVADRIELLKANIVHYTQDVLEYDVAEIRLIDRKTNRCEPLLSEGIDSEESRRPIYAESQENGVTGFVCATGQSYLCEDTTHDPLYLRGLIGARSSLTVPLILHEQVIGSFNVESPETNAFRTEDLQLLQIFARDIARALNSLELLVAEKTNAAQGIVESIQTGVGLPIDEVLNDTVYLIENQGGDDAMVARRLRRVLKNSRAIRDVIQTARNNMTFNEAIPEALQAARRPLLRNRRILVVDADAEVRDSAHKLLEPYGCIVETAHEGAEAIMMVRNCDHDANYDAIIADIRLPDFSGYEILMRLKSSMADPPLILMTGFGYDPGHSIVKARQAGLRPGSVVFKPFKADQVLETLERTVQQNSGGAGPVNGS